MSEFRAEQPEARPEEPEYVAATLAWCNRLRKKDGKDPLKRLPKGHTRDPRSCPCGKATGWLVDSSYARRPGVRPKSLPNTVRLFVIAFDDYQLPQYVSKAKKA